MERGKAKKESPSTQEVHDNQPKRNDTNNSKHEISIAIAEKKEPLHRVPDILRRTDPMVDDFVPMVVSLGPYHHGEKHLQVTLDDKRKARDQLLQAQGKTAENFCEEMRVTMEAARKLYVDDPEVSDFSTDHLILDACFIIHVMDYIAKWKKEGLIISPNLLPLVVEDMFLLENQVPFVLLKLAMDRLGIDAEDTIHTFVWRITESPRALKEYDAFVSRLDAIVSGSEESPRAPSACSCLRNWEDKCECICELLATPLVFVSEVLSWLGLLEQQWEEQYETHRNNIRSFWRGSMAFHLLQILRAHLLNYEEEKKPEARPYVWHPPRCATELKTAGISFESRSTFSLMDAKFKKGFIFGKLSIPSMNQLTKRRMVNLIAYELCTSGCGNGITSYVHFLDGLIDRPGDVKELRSKNILPKGLGSDEDVANFFNTVGANLAPDPSDFYNILEDIETHCDVKWRSDIASLCDKYFNGPWTIISSIIAALLFLLTIAQAYTSFFDGKK